EVRGPRQVLVIADDPDQAAFWTAALRVGGAFQCDVIKPAQTRDLGPRDLAKYQAICLLDVDNPQADLWDKLKEYVQDGGGLIVMPGGEELRQSAYRDEERADAAVNQLMPGTFEKLLPEADPPVEFDAAKYREPLRTWWRDWRDEDQS